MKKLSKGQSTFRQPKFKMSLDSFQSWQLDKAHEYIRQNTSMTEQDYVFSNINDSFLCLPSYIVTFKDIKFLKELELLQETNLRHTNKNFSCLIEPDIEAVSFSKINKLPKICNLLIDMRNDNELSRQVDYCLPDGIELLAVYEPMGVIDRLFKDQRRYFSGMCVKIGLSVFILGNLCSYNHRFQLKTIINFDNEKQLYAKYYTSINTKLWLGENLGDNLCYNFHEWMNYLNNLASMGELETSCFISLSNKKSMVTINTVLSVSQKNYLLSDLIKKSSALKEIIHADSFSLETFNSSVKDLLPILLY